MKFLVVDDEPDLEHLVSQKFRKQIRDGSLSFHFAGDGVEALSKVQEHPEYALVLTDINMPKMDGLLLGKIPNIEYDSAKIKLEKGDRLVLFTDGVTEAMNPVGVMYEEPRLEHFLSHLGPGTCQNLTDSLFEDVLRFADGAEQSDDITVLTLGRT